MILQICRTTLLKIEGAYCASGSSRAGARVEIARKLGIGSGTLENLIRDRVKTVSADLAAQIQRLWINTIEAKMAHLEHERDLARKNHIDLSADDLGRLDSLLEEARVLLREKAKGRR